MHSETVKKSQNLIFNKCVMYETSRIFYTVSTFIMPELLWECAQLHRWRKKFRIINGYIRIVQICQKSRRHLKFQEPDA